jgi:Peptidase A4 family
MNPTAVRPPDRTVRRGGLAGIACVVAIVASGLSTGSAGAATPHAGVDHAPMVPDGSAHVTKPKGTPAAGGATQNSLDWAGYAATGTTFTNVAGSWTQPSATCSTKASQAAFWVGIDGYASTDPTVQQIGTDSDCVKVKGKKTPVPLYYAWYQMYPGALAVLSTTSFPVAPGDVLTASVSLSGPTYTLAISDGAKWSFSTNQTPVSLPLNASAEWIAEAPTACVKSKCKVVPLTDFSSVGFTGATANGLPISSSSNVQIDMTTKGGKTVLAQTSGLGGGGNNFSVTWLNA